MVTQTSLDSEDEANKIPFSKKTQIVEKALLHKTKDQQWNAEIIKKCMKYLQHARRDCTTRNYDIDMAIEEYLADQRKMLFDLLEEIEHYPAGI